jgi:hypothetical protein
MAASAPDPPAMIPATVLVFLIVVVVGADVAAGSDR